MNVTVECFGQLGALASPTQGVELQSEQATMGDLLSLLAEKYGQGFADIVFDDHRNIRPSLVLVVNEGPVDKSNPPVLHDGDRVRLLTAIAGG